MATTEQEKLINRQVGRLSLLKDIEKDLNW
jgi:hypothetical protein